MGNPNQGLSPLPRRSSKTFGLSDFISTVLPSPFHAQSHQLPSHFPFFIFGERPGRLAQAREGEARNMASACEGSKRTWTISFLNGRSEHVAKDSLSALPGGRTPTSPGQSSAGLRELPSEATGIFQTPCTPLYGSSFRRGPMASACSWAQIATEFQSVVLEGMEGRGEFFLFMPHRCPHLCNSTRELLSSCRAPA